MYAIKGMQNNQANVKEQVNNYEISVAFDDSCGVSNNLTRSDIRIYDIKTNADVTFNVFNNNNTIEGTIYNLIEVYKWCQNDKSTS